MMSHAAALLDFDRWDRALAWLAAETGGRYDDGEAIHAYVKRCRTLAGSTHFASAANAVVDFLFDRGRGGLAIAWMAMTADPRRPDTFVRFIPQLAHIVDRHGDAEQKARLEVWWRAAAGEYADADNSIFVIADFAVCVDKEDTMQPLAAHAPRSGFGLFRRGPVPADHVVSLWHLAQRKGLDWTPLGADGLALVPRAAA